MILTVPADLEARVGAVVGAPFVPKGDDPSGWDCRGCARWCLGTFCGVWVPTYSDLYEASILLSVSGRRERARLIADGLAAWRPVAPQAGAIAWLEWMGGAGHVGFLLGPDRAVHADARCGTVLLDLTDPAAGYQLKGAFVPGHITRIVQEG